MSQSIYRSQVRVIDLDGDHVRHIESFQARILCDANLAESCELRGSTFVGTIGLLISREEFVAEFMPAASKGRPKPAWRPPASSTGDAGRGFVFGARYRVLHMERQAALA